MSHASATRAVRPARSPQAAAARPLLVVERLDHTVDLAVMVTGNCFGPTPSRPSPAQATATAALEGVAGAWV